MAFIPNLLGLLFRENVSRVLGSVAELRTVAKSRVRAVHLTGYYAPGDGGGGSYYLDSQDNASADNGGSVIVANDGARWKLAPGGMVGSRQFGAKGDGVADDTAALNKWLAYLTAGAALNQHSGYWQTGIYKVTGAGLLVTIADTMPNMVTDGAEQVVVKGDIPVLMTFTVSGGSGMLPTAEWGGVKCDGIAANGNVGVRVSGLCFTTFKGWHFYRLAEGVNLHNGAAGSFTEGIIFDEPYFDTSVLSWLHYSKGAGDGSFRNSGLRQFRGNLGAAALQGVLIDNGCVPYMGWLDGTVWNFHANGVLVRNNSSQVPLVGNVDTETQSSQANKLTLGDTAGTGYTFLHGSILGWNYASGNLKKGKLVTAREYFNTNDGLGQMFALDASAGEVTTTGVGQQILIPFDLGGVNRPYLQPSAILTISIISPDGYVAQGVYLLLTGATANIVNPVTLNQGILTQPGGQAYGAPALVQGTAYNVKASATGTPVGTKYTWSIKYLNGLIKQ